MTIASHEGAKPTEATIQPTDVDELLRRNQAAIALLDEWDRYGDDQEQRETMQVIREGLGSNRIGSSRALLP